MGFIMKNLKTTIFNETHHAFNIRFWPVGIDMLVLLPMMRLVVDTPTSYTYLTWEFFLAGVTSLSDVVLFINIYDAELAKEIRIYELLDNDIRYRISKVHNRGYDTGSWNLAHVQDLAQFAVVKKDASTSMKSIERLCANMEELLKQVIVFHSQCDNLVRIFLKGIQEVRNIPDFEDENVMWTSYQSQTLKDLINSLDSLLRALMSAEQLLQACSGKEWKRVALVLSMAPPEFEKYSGSWFSLLIRDFNWSLEKIRYLKAPHRSIEANPTFVTEELLRMNSGFLKDECSEELEFMWIDHKRRYGPQRNMHAFGATTDEGGFHEDNVDQEPSESTGEIRVVTDAIEMHEDYVDQEAFDCKDEIETAVDEEESLKGDFERQALDRKDLLVNIEKKLSIHTLGNPIFCLAWQLCGNKFVADETSNNKFSAVVKNRCQDTLGLCDGNLVSKCFEIDYLDLKMKKPISGGSFKRIYSANWLGQEVAVAMVQHIPRDVVEKEAGFLVKLHHPNVVDFFGFALKEEALTEEERNAVEVIEPK